ncbi:MAG: hypothetical protein P8Y39_12755 [Nitrospirota bacterium]
MKEAADDIARRFRWCSHFEEITAEAYDLLAEQFSDDPEAWRFFSTLSLEEKDHANVMRFGRVYGRPEKMPFPSPDWPGIYRTIQMSEELLKRARSGRLSLQEALSLALGLEESTAEAYYFDLMRSEEDLGILKRLREIFSAEETHAEMIREFMAQRGLAR